MPRNTFQRYGQFLRYRHSLVPIHPDESSSTVLPLGTLTMLKSQNYSTYALYVHNVYKCTHIDSDFMQPVNAALPGQEVPRLHDHHVTTSKQVQLVVVMHH